MVDASGRVSAVQAWLREGGYALPRTVEVNAGVGYSGAIFDVPKEVLFKSLFTMDFLKTWL